MATRPPKSAAPKAGAFRERKSPPTNFRLMYDRGDLPLRVANGVVSMSFGTSLTYRAPHTASCRPRVPLAGQCRGGWCSS